MPYQPIEDHGIIGDLYTVALVAMDGCIDFLCFPFFDSPSIFASLLDDERGGRFELAPKLDNAKHRQSYLPDTNVLITRFLSSDGVAEVSDFMPVEEMGFAHNLVRRAKCIRGELDFRMVCDPRFNYGRSEHRVELIEGGACFRSLGPDKLVLKLLTAAPLKIHNGMVVSEFTLAAGMTMAFVLEGVFKGEEATASASDEYVSGAFRDTVNFWRKWLSKCTYTGRWREAVNRSALTLKLLTSRPHGSMVAAPTFGLPEVIGGARNWDYRYTWIRDASFTLYALIRLGFTAEAKAFMVWIEARCREATTGNPLQTMYGLDGHSNLREFTLKNLRGYKGSHPVRVGNGAAKQLQLDIYGELLDSVYLYDKYGEPISYDLWTAIVRMVNWVCANYDQPDEGMWEVRGGQQEFLNSRVMCWVAIDRAMRLATKRSFPAPHARWTKVRDAIYRGIMKDFWNPKLGSFVQHKNTTALDASALLMPLVRFISPTDPRWLSTLRAIESHLVEDSLVYRYDVKSTPDGLVGHEGTFCMCTFWYVECLSRSGDVEKARFYFEKMLGYANHLGLYAEELGPKGEHLGNFPQAFTHLALISSAFHINRSLTEKGIG
ncbi:glycoside hydrolase family 15 protein [soil metagenome]